MAKFKVSKYGQWEYPGENTIIPSGDITMQGVPYPVLGIDNLGNTKIMQPGGNYQFPGNMVYEIPMAYGGDISIPDLSRPNWLDKAQKGQQVRYYDDLKSQQVKYYGDLREFKIAEEEYKDSLEGFKKYPLAPYFRSQNISRQEFTNEDNPATSHFININNSGASILNSDFARGLNISPSGLRPTGNDYEWVYKRPTQKPVYKPKEYIPTKTVKLEREPIQLVMPQSDRMLNDYNNTLQVLRSMQQDDRDKQGPKVVPAPDFRHGGWLDKYQGDKQPSQVAANLPWLGNKGQILTEQEQEEKFLDKKFGIGPTVDKAEAIKAKETLRKTKRIETPLPSGAITPVMGPVEYALMAPVAGASAMRAAPMIGSALSTPLGLPGATIGNALGAGFATDAMVNRLPEIPGQLRRGEYMDAAVNAATGALDLYGAGMVSPLFKGAKAAKKLPGSPNSGNVVDELREELQREGIVSSQKTLNLPWKDIIRKGVRPWAYDIPEKTGDIHSLIVPRKNPSYVSRDELFRAYENHKKFIAKPGDKDISFEEYMGQINEDQLFMTRGEVVNNRFDKRFAKEELQRFKNRYATWDMYLGKPQTENPMYDISHLTKSKDDVIYTIKEDFMDKPTIEHTLSRMIDDIESGSSKGANIGTSEFPFYRGNVPKKKGDNKWIMLDQDGYFGTMGGFHWDIKKLSNGNYEAYANDVWDLQPFKGKDSFLRNIEVGKALGIGKPLNVKVGFEIDKDTKKILKTYGMAPGAVAGAAALQKEKDGGWLDRYQVGAEVNCEDGNCRETDEIQAIYDQAQRIPERVVDFERGVAEQLWTDPKTGKEKKFLTINSGNPSDDARNIWKQHGAPDYFPSPSCMYVAGLGWRCAPETKEYMSNFDPLPFNSNTGFINAVNKSGLPFKRAAETDDPYFDAQQKGKLRPGDVVNFKGPDVSHAMTFIGYDDKGRSDWFHSNGIPNMVGLENNLWEDLRKPGVKKYVNRFDEDRYVKETYGDKIEQLEKQARENPTYYKKRGGIATDNQDYNYIKYKDLSLSKGTGWLDNYK
jgi:hypothetical protein